MDAKNLDMTSFGTIKGISCNNFIISEDGDGDGDGEEKISVLDTGIRPLSYRIPWHPGVSRRWY